MKEESRSALTTVMSLGALRKSYVMADGTCSYVTAVGMMGSRRWITTSPLEPFRGRHSPGTGPPGVRMNCRSQNTHVRDALLGTSSVHVWLAWKYQMWPLPD